MKNGRKKNFKRVALAAFMVLSIGLMGGCDTQKGADVPEGAKKVGVIQLAEHLALDRAYEGFVEGLAEEGFKDGENISIELANAQGDQSNLSTISQNFVSGGKDLVCAIATPAAVSIASNTTTIPIVGTAITDYVAAGLAQSNEAPGKNITGTSDLADLASQMELIQKVMPDLKTLGIIYSSAEENSRVQVNIIKDLAAKAGIQVVEQTVSNVNDIQQQASELVKKVDAVYAPTDNIISSAMPNLIGITDEAKIPVFCAEAAQVEKGALATRGIDYKALGVQTGKMAARILRGEAKPETMAIESAENYKVTVNKKAAEKLGITLPAELLKDADTV